VQKQIVTPDDEKRSRGVTKKKWEKLGVKGDGKGKRAQSGEKGRWGERVDMSNTLQVGKEKQAGTSVVSPREDLDANKKYSANKTVDAKTH